MADTLTISAFNVEELSRALTRAPALAYRYAKTEIGRIGNRVKKGFMRERMAGAPGIAGGEWKRQHKRHVRVNVGGSGLESLAVSLTISRFLALHEEGGTLTAHNKGAQMLRIPIGKRRGLAFRGSRFTRDAAGHIQGLFVVNRPGRAPLLVEKVNGKIVPRFVLVPSVRIPARLQFRDTASRLFRAHAESLHGAVERAIRQALEQDMKQIGSWLRAA